MNDIKAIHKINDTLKDKDLIKKQVEKDLEKEFEAGKKKLIKDVIDKVGFCDEKAKYHHTDLTCVKKKYPEKLYLKKNEGGLLDNFPVIAPKGFAVDKPKFSDLFGERDYQSKIIGIGEEDDTERVRYGLNGRLSMMENLPSIVKNGDKRDKSEER